VVAAGAVALVVGVLGAPSEGEDSPIKVERPKPSPTSKPASSPASSPGASTTPTATPTPLPVVKGFRFPIEGACLPAEDDLIPNAPREYRFGVHEGVDFYPGRACATIDRGTPVLAAKTGIVVRADVDYKDITQEEMDGHLARSAQQGFTEPLVLDRLRGRQVWLDHGNGVVTRYCHLLSIQSGITKGTVVEGGQVVAYVGNSGTPEGVSDPNIENHLHFEIRLGDGYLGQGLSAVETRRLLELAFSP
jgi:murein DD-endopeptidase MepM/ murein hydrolase activator NlpD